MSETVKTALTSLRANKIRSILTMLGVVIGVFAVISLVSIGTGIQSYVTDSFNDLGADFVIVAPGKVDFADDPAKYFSKNQLSEKHITLIENNADEFVEAVTPSVRVGQTVKYKTKEYFTTVIGGNYQANKIINFNISEGRYFTRGEEKSEAKVAVLGALAKEDLFGTSNALGEKINIAGEQFEVIGILEKKGQQYDDAVLAPYTTTMDIFDVENFSSIGVKIKNKDQVDSAIRSIELALLRDMDSDDFTVFSSTQILNSIQNILGILTLGIGAIAGISLLVGGIGIMNIMLVSVTERTREIGLRKAVGATPNSVATQFLFEAVFLSAVGGVIGILLGILLAFGISSFVQTSVSIESVLIAFGFSLVVGVVFGTYPAITASRKDPIEALAYE